MTLTLDYLRPCTLLDPLRPDLNQDARIDYLPRPTPSWGVRSLYGSDLGAQSDQPRSHPIGPGLPSASLWMAIYPFFPLVGSFLTPVWPQDWEESTITLFHLNMTDILTYSYYLCSILVYHLCMRSRHVHYITLISPLYHGITLRSPQHHSLDTSLLYGRWNPPSTRVLGPSVGARQGGSLVKGKGHNRI